MMRTLIEEHPVLFGLLGVLVGAIITGIFTFWGSERGGVLLSIEATQTAEAANERIAVAVARTVGSIRTTLLHLLASQQNYLSLLTLPLEARRATPPAFAELQEAARSSGEGLLALARGELSKPLNTQLQTKDGYLVEPWVVMVQVINHATEHREQISSILTSLGLTPPDLDGWTYGEVTNALIPIST